MKKQAEIRAAQQEAIEAKEQAEAERKAKRQAELAEVRSSHIIKYAPHGRETNIFRFGLTNTALLFCCMPSRATILQCVL